MDGTLASFSRCDPDANGQSLLVWNTTFEPPGQHYLQAQLTVNGMLSKGSTPDNTVLAGLGQVVPFNSTNVCQFDPFFAEYDSSGATLYASLPEPDADYTIELLGPTGEHIKTITNSTSSGEIMEHWDLTYDDGTNIYTGAAADAVFNVNLLDPATGTHVLKLYTTSSYVPEGTFTVAYAWNNDSIAQGAMRDCVQWGVVDELIKPTSVGGENDNPYISTYNSYSWSGGPGNPGYLSSSSDAWWLLSNNLVAFATRNFYFDGHGNPTAIGDNKSASDPTSVTLTTGMVGSLLQNRWDPNDGAWRQHPYRFVFLNACETADDQRWAHAWGIYGHITALQVTQRPEAVQAFVGWIGEPRGADSASEWYDEAQTYAVFFAAWMNGMTLDQCISMASSAQPFGWSGITLNFPLGTKYGLPYSLYTANNFAITVYGYRWITRTSYQMPP